MNRLDTFSVALSGRHLVEASAGTGKTHAITNLYLRAVIERGLLPAQILVVTFTRAATSELKNRIRNRLQHTHQALSNGLELEDTSLRHYLDNLRDRALAEQRLRRALRSIDDAAVFTIHGLCQRVLQQHAFESQSRFELQLLESLDDLYDEALNDSLVAELAGTNPSLLRRFLAPEGTGRTAALLRELQGRPGHPLLPAAARPQSLHDAIERFREAQRQAKRHYDFDSIFEQLSQHPGLNRQKVRLKGLAARITSDARIFEPFSESEPWPDRCILQNSYLETCLKKGNAKPPQHPIFLACDALHAEHERLDTLLSDAHFALMRTSATRALELASKRKANFAVQGFEDLLRSLHDALDRPDGAALAQAVRERFPFTMIDEFQDTDPIQFSIFSRIYSTPQATLFLIGDPKQSIYAFRGADLHAYLTAASSGLERHSLDVNWRSDPGLINAINALYVRRSNPFSFPAIEYRPMDARPNARDSFDDDGSPVTGMTLALVETETSTMGPQQKLARLCATEAAKHVQQWLSRHQNGRRILPRDIAILTRTNDEAHLMQDALRERQIQSSLATDTSVLSTPDADRFVALLRAIVNPNDGALLGAALLTPGFGVSPPELIRRLAEPNLWDRDAERFMRAHDLLLRHGIFAATQWILEKYGVVEQLLLMRGGERQVTNLYHLMEIAEFFQSRHNLLPHALLRSMLELRVDPTAIASETRQLRIESDEHSVAITTIHRSKGLEYPIVICPFLWASFNRPLARHDVLRYYDATSHRWVLDLRGRDAPSDALGAATSEREAEALRLIYVALTRARHAVTVFIPKAKGVEASPLGRMLTPEAAEPRHLAFADLEMGCQELARQVPEIRLVASGEPEPAAPSVNQGVRPLQFRALTRPVSQRWAASSFSALVAGQPAHSLGHLEESGRDIDAQSTDVVPSAMSTRTALFSVMPPGAESGDTLHKILELVDFAHFDPNTDSIVEPLLARFGSKVQEASAAIRRDVAAVLDSRLLATDPSFTLRSVNPERRHRELSFSMGVGFDSQGGIEKSLFPAQLAAALTPEATGLHPAYSQSVAQLKFEPLAGYLRGFIDLVFEHEGRTYVIDYKSTSMSESINGFTQSLIAEVVAANHYALQTALYALVMHRYLRWRKPDYDYERDFGGTLLVFLRGLSPEQPPGHAVYFHRAPIAAINSLDTAFSSTRSA